MAKPTETRTRAPARAGSKKTYQPPQRMEIPKEIRERFAEQDFALRWIRVKVKNADDYKQISKRQREGYVFVKPDEVADLVEHLGLLPNAAAGMVLNGDLALAKVHFADQQARQDYYEDMARSQENAYMRDLERQSNRTMPIYNDSRSVARTGRSAEFARD